MDTIQNTEDVKTFLLHLSSFVSRSDKQSILDHLYRCEQIAIKFNDNPLLIQTRIHLTEFFIQINDLKQALLTGLTNKQLAEDEKLKDEELKCYSGLLNIYYLLGDYATLEQLIYTYREKLIDTNDINKLCSLYIISAIQFYATKDYKKCIESNQKALEYALKINSISLLIHVYNNYGFHAINYDLVLAEKLLNEGLALIKETDDNLYALAAVHSNLADLYFKKKEYKSCNKSLDISIKCLKAIHNKTILLETQNRLSELFIHTEKYSAAIKLLKHIEKECLSTNNRAILLVTYSHFYLLYEKIQDYKLAYEYLSNYQKLKEELFNEESSNKIRNLQIANETNNIKREKDLAERIAHLKHDFLANMSHEIRTPINSVLGICYLLQQEILSKKQEDYIQRLERSGQNLLGLINEILDMSKIEAGKFELVIHPFSFNTILSDVVKSLQAKAEEKNILLNFTTVKELDRTIKGDPLRMSQVLINFISNAIKFTNDGAVEITASTEKTNNNNLLVICCIKDTGIGIPADKIQTIFERYEQASASIKTQFGGTGLGLAISKKFIDMMDGKIEIESIVDAGTTFTIKIPFEIADNEQLITEEEKQDSRFLNNLQIIIADDDDENRKVTIEILKHFNSSVEINEAVNGMEVLELLKSIDPDIILLDLDMPVMNGFDTAKAIRIDTTNFDIKIIAHTAGLLTSTKSEILSMGFDELLTKPFKPTELLKKLFFVTQ